MALSAMIITLYVHVHNYYQEIYFYFTAPHFISLLEVMCGPPLYLDNTLVATILTTCPHHIVTITSPVRKWIYYIQFHE